MSDVAFSQSENRDAALWRSVWAEVRLCWISSRLCCYCYIIQSENRCVSRRYVALTASALKRVGKINGDWSCSPVYCGSTRDRSYQGVQTGTTGGFSLWKPSHCIVDYSLLRWTVVSGRFEMSVCKSHLRSWIGPLSAVVYWVMLSAFNTLPESEPGTGHWFTPSII